MLVVGGAASLRLAGQGGASFGIAALTLAYGGVAEPGAFGLAFALAAALSGASTLTALGIERTERELPSLSEYLSAAEDRSQGANGGDPDSIISVVGDLGGRGEEAGP